MARINYASDFKIVEVIKSTLKNVKFEWVYTIDGSGTQKVVSFDGSSYSGDITKLSDTQFKVVFNGHGFRPGYLRCKRTFYIADTDYSDGYRKVVYEDTLPVQLVPGSGDEESGITNYVLATVVTKCVTDSEILDIKNSIFASAKTDTTFLSALAGVISADEDFLEDVYTDLLTSLKSDSAFLTSLVNSIKSNTTLLTSLKTTLAGDSSFNSSLATNVATLLKNDTTFKSDLVTALKTDTDLLTQLKNTIKSDSVFISAVATAVNAL